MSQDPKKIAVATAAVMEYLASEKRSGPRVEEPRVEAAPLGAAGPRHAAGSLWAVQGRAELMQLRGLMQWKALQRS